MRDAFTVIGVFNPGVAKIKDEVALLVRPAEKPREHRPGFIGLPRFGAGGDVVVDWVSKAELDLSDSQVIRCKDSCGAVVHNGQLILPYAMSDYATTFGTIPIDQLISTMEPE